MARHSFSLPLLAVAIGALPVLGQSPPTTGPWSLRDVHGIVAGPEGPVGIGADYKAHFTAGGVAFTPALGDAAPHNLPLQWSLLDIRRGGDVVHEAATSVVPEAVGGAVQFARGAVTERSDVLANGPRTVASLAPGSAKPATHIASICRAFLTSCPRTCQACSTDIRRKAVYSRAKQS